MKQQQNVLLLAMWLIALPLQLLWAQDKEPFFNLKKGDWFMYRVNINSAIQSSLPSSQPKVYTNPLGVQFKHQSYLKFTAKEANGNQKYVFLQTLII